MALLYATFVLILVGKLPSLAVSYHCFSVYPMIGGVLLSLVQPQSITAAWWSAWTWVADPGR
jgi:hypothetical protein